MVTQRAMARGEVELLNVEEWLMDQWHPHLQDTLKEELVSNQCM